MTAPPICALAAALAALLAAVAAPVPARAVDPVDMAAAKKEGAVTWCTSTPVAAAQKIAGPLKAQTGINVELFRSGGSAVLRRFLQEIDARRVVADAVAV